MRKWPSADDDGAGFILGLESWPSGVGVHITPLIRTLCYRIDRESHSVRIRQRNPPRNTNLEITLSETLNPH